MALHEALMKSAGLEADPAMPGVYRAKKRTTRERTKLAMDLKHRNGPDGKISDRMKERTGTIFIEVLKVSYEISIFF